MRTCLCLEAEIAGAGPDGREPDGIVDGTDFIDFIAFIAFIAFINSFAARDPAADPLADIAGGGADGLSPNGSID